MFTGLSMRLTEMKWVGLIALAVATNVGANTEEVSVQREYKENIAVIGAGASGLTAAYLLKRDGYQNVTVFEKESSVGGVAHTVTVDGKAYDISTMFVPGATIAGDGIEPLLQEMIDVSKEPLIPAVDFDTLNLPSAKLDVLNSMHQSIAPEELSRQLITGLTLMTKWVSCLANNIDSVTCGITLPDNPNENIHDWGARNGVPAFTHLVTYTSDALGAGPTSYTTATLGLAGGGHWTPVEVVRILQHLGLKANDLPEGTPPNILSLMSANDGNGSQRWWFFKNGYQTFWKSLQAKAKIRVKLSEPVLELKKGVKESHWVIKTNKRAYHFDKVIVASTPRAAMHFLPEGPQKELLRTAIVRTPPNDVYLSKISDYETTEFPSQAAWWPEGMGLGTLDLINPDFGSLIKPFFWQKRHNNNLVVIGTYTLSPEITPDQAYSATQNYAANNFGLQVGDQVVHERFFFPSSPADRKLWSEQWPALQGVGGLFFIGEAFTGSGVPAISSGLSRMIPKFFPKK